MLRLAKLADYGLLIACHLANLPDELVKLEQVAEATQLPVPTVRKVMKLLVDQGIIRSERGMKGGYALSRPANRINIGEVIIAVEGDRKSTRLNSSHVKISYAVFCLKKKK